ARPDDRGSRWPEDSPRKPARPLAPTPVCRYDWLSHDRSPSTRRGFAAAPAKPVAEKLSLEYRAAGSAHAAALRQTPRQSTPPVRTRHPRRSVAPGKNEPEDPAPAPPDHPPEEWHKPPADFGR